MKHLFRFPRFLERVFEKIRRIFGLSGREVFYINGADTLPPPLTSEEEEELAVRKSDPEVRAMLIERNLRLVVFVAKRFEKNGTNIEELISIGTVGLMKAVDSFCPEKKIRLATYASRCIENEILMFLRRSQTRKKEVSLDEPLSVDWDGNELLLSDILGTEEDSVSCQMEEAEELTALRRALKHLDERERVIVSMRFGLDGREEMTQKDVADRLGISQSYISRLEKKIMTELKDELTAKS